MIKANSRAEISDEATRRRVLHLSCCLLPKAHRDTMEVLFCFLNWASSFSVVDEESGSKMDIHNLATVVAPNILFSNNKTEGMEDSFLAIEAVHCLIECNESMCEVSHSALYSSKTSLHPYFIQPLTQLPLGPRRPPIHPKRLHPLQHQRRTYHQRNPQTLCRRR